MRLEKLCELDLRYLTDFHFVSPYEGRSGNGWGHGEGTASGTRLSGTVQWSNHPTGRGDGTMQPLARGVIRTPDEAEVLLDLTGRSVFIEREGSTVGRQLLMALFESGDARYRWLNNTVCMAEGTIDPVRLAMHMDVHLCIPELGQLR